MVTQTLNFLKQIPFRKTKQAFNEEIEVKLREKLITKKPQESKPPLHKSLKTLLPLQLNKILYQIYQDPKIIANEFEGKNRKIQL